MTRRALRWALAIGWAAVIWVLSSIPASRLPAVQVWNLDKLVHAAVFGILAVLTQRAIDRPRGVPRAIVVFLLVTAWGVLDEFHQRFVPGRVPSVYDAIADAVGAALAIGIAGKLRRS